MHRIDLLKKIIKMEGNLNNFMKELNNFTWDSKEELVVLEKKDVAYIIKQYLDRKLKDFDVENWANIIESREDIKFNDPLVKEIIYELANPDLVEKLTRQKAEELLKKLDFFDNYTAAHN